MGEPSITPEQIRVIAAAIAYCLGTYPDDDPLDEELRAAVGQLTETDDE